MTDVHRYEVSPVAQQRLRAALRQLSRAGRQAGAERGPVAVPRPQQSSASRNSRAARKWEDLVVGGAAGARGAGGRAGEAREVGCSPGDRPPPVPEESSLGRGVQTVVLVFHRASC